MGPWQVMCVAIFFAQNLLSLLCAHSSVSRPTLGMLTGKRKDGAKMAKKQSSAILRSMLQRGFAH